MNEVKLRGKLLWRNRTELAGGRKTLMVLQQDHYRFDCVCWDDVAQESKDLEMGSLVDIVGHITSFRKKNEEYPRMQIIVDQLNVLDEEFSFE